ncbi:DUF2225 domain-containing protein [Exiguobacterium acetylicum]|uniref:DUF2225 domain-containing protein n=1 Tax=Exiguobacterium acetylicum TaxID=41170 RepID=A0ABX8G7K6_EXIAC|nr:DUF2225 domain-containing protein [Exiguobacterium acetylicum]QWB29558.1 DUF2225 domain-containing protein [Exiguobacterium acetylicum]
MPDLYLKKCTCPYCLKTTETKRVLSRHIRVASTDFDGFIRHQGVNVYLYEPVQCSHCRFFFHESFEKLSPDVRTTLQDHILPTLPVLPFASTERTIEQAIQLYKLCLYTAQVTEQKPAIQAMLGVRLSWLHRLTGQQAEEQLWANRAIEKYLPLYEDYTSVKESGIPEDLLLLRIADLYAVTKDKEQARLWYSRLFQSKTATDKVKKDARTHWEWVQEQD